MNEKSLADRIITPNLWQLIDIQHMMINLCNNKWGSAGIKEIIDYKEWCVFVETFQDAFAEEVSQLAITYWRDRHVNGMVLE